MQLCCNHTTAPEQLDHQNNLSLLIFILSSLFIVYHNAPTVSIIIAIICHHLFIKLKRRRGFFWYMITWCWGRKEGCHCQQFGCATLNFFMIKYTMNMEKIMMLVTTFMIYRNIWTVNKEYDDVDFVQVTLPCRVENKMGLLQVSRWLHYKLFRCAIFSESGLVSGERNVTAYNLFV